MNETPIAPSEVFAGLIRGSRDPIRSWTLPPDLPYFDGHFPEGAVLPAVGIIDASLCVVGAIMGELDPRLFEVTVAKFTQTLGPGDEVVIAASEDRPGLWTVDWRSPRPAEGDKPFVSLKLKVARA